MNQRERFQAIMHFERPDRYLNEEWDYWPETLERWRQEGMAADKEPEEYFSLDPSRVKHFLPVNTGLCPAFECRVLREEGTRQVIIDTNGVICEVHKDGATAIPHYLEFPVKGPADWEKIKERYRADDPRRFPPEWPELAAGWKNRDHRLGLCMGGFFGVPRDWMGFENLMYAYYDQPDLLLDMMAFWRDFSIAMIDRVFQDVQPDWVQFWEDMAYRSGLMISPKLFRRFMTPYYKDVIDSIRSKGVDLIFMDCDGLLMDSIDLFLEAGIVGFYPMEIRAGNDPVALRERYGRKILMMGGIDKNAVADGPKAIDEELARRLPPLLTELGYIPFIDHHVHPQISLEDFTYYISRKEVYLREAFA